MSAGDHDSHPLREVERAERARAIGHREANWAAQGVAAANLVVVVYAVLAIGMLVTAWAGDAARQAAIAASGLVYGAAIAILVAAIGLLAVASERVVRGAYDEGQGVHLGLLLGAAGTGLVSAVIVGVGLIDDHLRRARFGASLAGCLCVGGWPALVALWNVAVLVRHGHRIRHEDAPLGDAQ